MRPAIARGATALALALSFPVGAAAVTAEDAIKYRHAVMEEMAAHMSSLTLILFGKVDGGDYAQGHADALTRALAEMEILFPDISKDGDTEALPAIWKNPDKFAEAVAKAQTSAGAFREALAGGDRKTALAAFADTGKACKACHEVYRAEEHDHDH